jgi:glycosyltransferase involved in cell wall biosynthesis/predicted ATP-grasp superfamily ATP-dependent carboligase
MKPALTEVPVLVLDGHTTQALACVRSLGRAGHPVYVASEQRWPMAVASRYCSGHWRLRGETVTAYADLRARAARLGIKIVLPLTERTCLLCSAEADAWRTAGITVGCGPDEMLFQVFDKAQALELARAAGISIPPTRCPESLDGYHEAARELGFPCVIKARFSYAWCGGQLLQDPGVAYVEKFDDLDEVVLARRQGAHWPLIQRWVPGTGRGVFALCDHGRVVEWFAHERLRDVRPSGSGSSLRRSVALDPELQRLSAQLLARLRWHGPAMLEFKDDGAHAPRLMEINGRFWGSLQLAISAGVDLPAQWIRILTGQPPAPSTGYRCGVTLRWVWGDVKRLVHILAGPPRGYPGSYPTLRQGVRELIGRQPPGTKLETFDRTDPMPAFAEFMQGAADLIARRTNRRSARRIGPLSGKIEEGAAAPDVTIILPCRNEAAYIRACLDSLLGTDYPHEHLEILVVDGGSTDGTREIVKEYADAHARLRLLDNPDRIVPTALNAGIREATGEIIVRMDAHVIYPPEYVPRLVAGLRETGADNVGGCIVTLPADGTPVAQAIAIALSHPFGVGNSHFRIGSPEARFVDTVPFGCYHRSVFARIGLFDEELIRNQDDEFNHRLLRHGGRVLLLPDVVSYYYARRSIRQVARMYYQYGYFKPLAARKIGRVMTVRQLVPSAFLAGLIGGGALSLLWPPIAPIWGLTVGAYAGAVLACALPIARIYGLRCAAALAAVFPALHLSYGAGFLRGLWDGVFRRRTPRSAPVPLSR